MTQGIHEAAVSMKPNRSLGKVLGTPEFTNRKNAPTLKMRYWLKKSRVPSEFASRSTTLALPLDWCRPMAMSSFDASS